VSHVRYELGSYTTEDDILNSHRPENLKSYENLLHNSRFSEQSEAFWKKLLASFD
jgi:hypothetical protein